jgi:tetratricopeptide (TPR) repeat protein
MVIGGRAFCHFLALRFQANPGSLEIMCRRNLLVWPFLFSAILATYSFGTELPLVKATTDSGPRPAPNWDSVLAVDAVRARREMDKICTEGGRFEASLESYFRTVPMDALVHSGRNIQSDGCKTLSKWEEAKGKHLEKVNEINEEGRTKKVVCGTLGGSEGNVCSESLNPLRKKVALLIAQIQPLNDTIQALKFLCPEYRSDLNLTINLYAKLLVENCTEKGDPNRCEDALFNLAEIDFTRDQRLNLSKRERIVRQFYRWMANDNRGKKPALEMSSFTISLASHRRYLDSLPKGGRRDVILYRTGFIHGLMGQPEQAVPLWKELLENYPSSRQTAAALVQLGEFHFAGGEFDSANVHYGKVDGKDSTKGNWLDQTFYHKAEALFRTANYPAAISTYFEYLERVDKKWFPGDCRTLAVARLGQSFAALPSNYQEAVEFFRRNGARGYADTVFYELAMSLARNKGSEQAAPAMGHFLSAYPDDPLGKPLRQKMTDTGAVSR